MLSYGREYAIVILLVAPLDCMSFVLGNIFKAEGNLVLSMYGIVAGAIINIILDPILIFTLKLETLGAALATSFSQILTLVILATQVINGKSVIKLKVRNISKKLETYVDIVTTGIPTVFRQGLAALATALLCKQAVPFYIKISRQLVKNMLQ